MYGCVYFVNASLPLSAMGSDNGAVATDGKAISCWGGEDLERMYFGGSAKLKFSPPINVVARNRQS